MYALAYTVSLLQYFTFLWSPQHTVQLRDERNLCPIRQLVQFLLRSVAQMNTRWCQGNIMHFNMHKVHLGAFDFLVLFHFVVLSHQTKVILFHVYQEKVKAFILYKTL